MRSQMDFTVCQRKHRDRSRNSHAFPISTTRQTCVSFATDQCTTRQHRWREIERYETSCAIAAIASSRSVMIVIFRFNYQSIQTFSVLFGPSLMDQRENLVIT